MKRHRSAIKHEQRQMSRARRALNRFHAAGYRAEKVMPIEPFVPADARPLVQAIEHRPQWPDDLPPMTLRHPSWFRVMRMVEPHGNAAGWYWEPIGEAKGQNDAIALAMSQKHKCCVYLNSKLIFDNRKGPKRA
jgi:hypothetical protein